MWSPKPRKLKKKACQDIALASLEGSTFYPLTQTEGRRYGLLALVVVGPTPCPPTTHTRRPKKKQQYFSINNAAELAQFKDLLKKNERSEINILTLPVHQLEGMGHTISRSVPTVLRRNDRWPPVWPIKLKRRL